MVLESAKPLLERATGVRRPSAGQLKGLVTAVEPETYMFRDDGKTPNNPKLPLVIYRQAISFGDFDPAAVMEVLFAGHGWGVSWRDGIYSFMHYHSATHEVVGVARGTARVEYGGTSGTILELRAGDVAVHPAGVGHKRQSVSDDLLVVGAYPGNGGPYDEPHSTRAAHEEAVLRIAQVPLPEADPIYGPKGPLHQLWVR